MAQFISSFFRFVLKLVLAAFGLVFVVSLLAAALIMVALSLLRSLVTGKKAAPAMIFSRFRKFSPGSQWPGAPRRESRDGAAGKPGATSDVVDVEAREIKGDLDKRLP